MAEFTNKRIVLLVSTSLLATAGLVLNITSYQALFDASLDVIPELQKHNN